MAIACGIDIGTNSFRLLIAEVQDGCLHLLAHELITVRLGEGLAQSGCLAAASMIRGEAALSRFSEKMKTFSPHRVRCCATHALRVAGNRGDFQKRVTALTGITIEVLSGEEEARLALLGVLSVLPEQHQRYPLLLVDVGGGSTEIILQSATGSEPKVISLPLGAVGLTEEFGSDCEGMRQKTRAILVPAFRCLGAGEKMIEQASLLVASGGTATSLAALALGLKCYDARLAQNFIFSQTSLNRVVAGLAAISQGERDGLPGLGEGRGEIIIAGAVILQELQQACACPSLLVSDAGLLEGILLSATMG